MPLRNINDTVIVTDVINIIIIIKITIITVISISNCFYYNKFKGIINVKDLCVSVSCYPMVAPYNYRLPLKFDFKLTLDCLYTYMTPQCNYEQGNYALVRKNFLTSYSARTPLNGVR
jgi:hypothetical protein